MRRSVRNGMVIGLAAGAIGGGVVTAANAQAITMWIGAGVPGPVIVLPRQVAADNDPALQMVRQLDAEMGAMMEGAFAPPTIDAGFAQMMAQQAAMMRQVAAAMNAPPGGGMPGGTLTTGTMTFGNGAFGAGSCTQVTTITFDSDGQPHATVRRTGSACAALPSGPVAPPISVQVPPDAAPEAAPPEPAPAQSPRLIQVDHRRVDPRKPVFRG